MDEKKRNLKSTLSWVLLIIVSAGIGVASAIYLPDLFSNFRFIDFILFFLVFLFSFPLHIILHELGHLIGGALSGYQFIMFRLFHNVWIRTEHGISKRKQNVQGILGQALMVPPEDEANPPFLLYHSSGFLMNLLTGLLLIWIAQVIENPIGTFALYISAGVALILFITNIIPMKPNDGYNILQQIKRPETTQELTNILRLYAEMVKGTPFTELQQLIQIVPNQSIEDPNHVTLYTARAAGYFEQYEFQKAREIYENLWQQRDDLLEPHKPEVYLNYLFSLLMTDPHHEDVTEIKATSVYEQHRKMKLVDSLRVFTAESIFLEKDYAKAKTLLAEGEPYIAYAPTIAEENLERKLYAYLKDEISRLEN